MCQLLFKTLRTSQSVRDTGPGGLEHAPQWAAGPLLIGGRVLSAPASPSSHLHCSQPRHSESSGPQQSNCVPASSRYWPWFCTVELDKINFLSVDSPSNIAQPTDASSFPLISAALPCTPVPTAPEPTSCPHLPIPAPPLLDHRLRHCGTSFTETLSSSDCVAQS